jgi:hypothetical protein
MPGAAPCPDLQSLRQFLAGEASDSAEAFLEQHLLDCPDSVKHPRALRGTQRAIAGTSQSAKQRRHQNV